METTWRSVENGEMTDFPKQSAKRAVPLAAMLQCVSVCVCVCKTVNLLWKALLSHTPQHYCKNDTLGPGLVPSSTSYLLHLQGKDDFSPLLCQGQTFPGCAVFILALDSPKAINHPSKWGSGWAVLSGIQQVGAKSNPGLSRSPGAGSEILATQAPLSSKGKMPEIRAAD